jgi:nucleoside-diphosphate-sugar epimerase
MSKVLVTGGAGMVGSNLTKRLVAEGHRVFVVDNLWRGKKEYLLDDAGTSVIDLDTNFFELDLAAKGVLDDIMSEVDCVYHLADVVAGINYVFEHQGEVFRQNVLINTNTLDSARKCRPKAFVYAGTACSFPAHLQTSTDARPLREEDQYPAAPESAYGWSKLMGEYETSLLERETGIPCSILSLHNVYGAPADYSPQRGQVIPSLIRKAVRYPQEPFIVWGSGAQGRAFVHIDDVVDALIRAWEKGLGRGLIQIGPSTVTRIQQLAETIVELSGKDIPIQYDRSKPEGDRGRRADFSKATKLLGWEPRTDLQQGLGTLYKWIETRLTQGNPERH